MIDVDMNDVDDDDENDGADDAESLRQYLGLRRGSGHVAGTPQALVVMVHNTDERWIFSGELVDHWKGRPVIYDFNTPKRHDLRHA